MQGTITYLLTEQAQRVQMAATGQPVARKQTVTIDITAEDLDLMAVDKDGNAFLDLAGTFDEIAKRHGRESRNYAAALALVGWPGFLHNGASPYIQAYGADILALIRLAYAIREAESQKQLRKEQEEKALGHANGEHNRIMTETAYHQFLTDADARENSYSVRPRVEDLRSPADWWPENHEEFMAEIRRRNVADEKAKQSADEAREKAKMAYIVSWVGLNGDDVMRNQFADGLLCRESVITLIANAAFDAATIPEKAQYNSDFCRSNDCPCGSHDLDCLPSDIYQSWRSIKAKLPDGYEVRFKSVRECRMAEIEKYGPSEDEEETAGPAIYLAMIKMPHGPFTLERTIRLASNAST